jgi:hypothetical protein
MTQSSRIVRFGFVLATGIIALIGFAPSGAVAGSADSTQVAQSGTNSATILTLKGEGWCC